MNPTDIIDEFYDPGSVAHDILIIHSKAVAAKALSVARHVSYLNPDLGFIEEATMLHDIGIVFVNAPELGCHGDKPYICHGYLGRELLEREGFPLHALVCERHIGAGLGITDIEKYHLLLPRRDMKPLSIEEKIICYADKFYSKRIDWCGLMLIFFLHADEAVASRIRTIIFPEAEFIFSKSLVFIKNRTIPARF